MNDPLNDNFNEQAADLDRSMDVLRGHEGGFDPLRQKGKMGWKAEERDIILHKDAIVGLTGVNVSHADPSSYVSAAYTTASAIPGA